MDFLSTGDGWFMIHVVFLAPALDRWLNFDE